VKRRKSGKDEKRFRAFSSFPLARFLKSLGLFDQSFTRRARLIERAAAYVADLQSGFVKSDSVCIIAEKFVNSSERNVS
jgi:hypothetical protein